MTKADGSKFGKSEQGNIWLSADYTAPYNFYQFWINAADADLPSFTRYFTLKSKEEIEAREREFADNPRELKKLLAEELTKRVHSEEDFLAVMKVSELLFNRKASKETLHSLSKSALATVAEEIPSFKIPQAVLASGVPIADLLADHTSILASKGEVRRAIKGNAISINKEKITSHEAMINHEILLHGQFFMIENGKKNKYMVIAE